MIERCPAEWPSAHAPSIDPPHRKKGSNHPRITSPISTAQNNVTPSLKFTPENAPCTFLQAPRTATSMSFFASIAGSRLMSVPRRRASNTSANSDSRVLPVLYSSSSVILPSSGGSLSLDPLPLAAARATRGADGGARQAAKRVGHLAATARRAATATLKEKAVRPWIGIRPPWGLIAV